MKAVLLSSIPLPYHKIGSWNKRYTELILSKENPFEYIICPKVDENVTKNITSKYLLANRYHYEKIAKYYYKYSYYFFLKQLFRLLKQEKKLVIYIIDNIKLLNEAHDFLVSKKCRNQCTIVFNSCGYSYFFNEIEGVKFYDKINNFICSTNEAYQFELNRYSYISSKVSIIPNGVDSSKFYKLSESEISKSKEKIGFKDKKIILWVSQERPKKGLHVFIEAWENSILNNNDDYVLLVIGTSNVKQEKNIHYLGKITSDFLPIYYQCSDYYFFTTLVHEGFGLSLAEAIKCGTTCFASNLSPMKEVTKNGTLAYLVDNPNIVNSWTQVLNTLDSYPIQSISNFEDLNKVYDLKVWLASVTALINNLKKG